MRTFGLALLVAGIAGYYYCSQQLKTLEAVPEGISISDSFRYPAGKMEVGRFAGAALGGIGVLFLMFPQGR